MPNLTIPADGGALPAQGQTTRRLFLAAGSAAAVFATVKRAAGSTAAAASSHPDAELLALGPAIKEADRQQKLAIDAEAKVDDAFFEKKRALGPAPIAPEDPEWTAAIEALRKANEATEARRSISAFAEAMAAWKAQVDALEAEHTEAVEGLTGEANDKIVALRDEVANWQPETLAGLIFKARYAFDHYPDEYDDEIARSIVDDLLAIAETGLIACDRRA